MEGGAEMAAHSDPISRLPNSQDPPSPECQARLAYSGKDRTTLLGVSTTLGAGEVGGTVRITGRTGMKLLVDPAC